MNKIELYSVFIWGFLTVYLVTVLFLLSQKNRQIHHTEEAIIEMFYAKINKIPALVEIMKKYTVHTDICSEMIVLHRAAVITRIRSVYDLLELNDRLQREFSFLMKISAKIQNLHRDGNFLYIRDFLMFYETNIKKLISEMNTEIQKYNKTIGTKNLSIVGMLIPVGKKLVI